MFPFPSPPFFQWPTLWHRHSTSHIAKAWSKTKQQSALSLVTYPGVLASQSSSHPLPATTPNSRGGWALTATPKAATCGAFQRLSLRINFERQSSSPTFVVFFLALPKYRKILDNQKENIYISRQIREDVTALDCLLLTALCYYF